MLAATGSATTTRRRLGVFALALALVIGMAPTRAEAVPSNTPITIDGGGWGHGIGMPQWGAQGMAEYDDYTYDDILSYWYTGTGLKQASQTSANIPDPLRVGINYVLVNGTPEYRPFVWQDFNAINGPLEVCKPGQTAGGDCFTANPGETWRYRWYPQDGGFCALTRNGVSMWSHPSNCNVRIFWDDQPNTRVSFPGGDIARTFARGHISFVGPVTVNGLTGFHFNVVLDLEEYVKGIAEVPPSWHIEALKSQAVAARTFGAWKATGGIRSDCSCHLVWDTWDQAYRGWHSNSEGDPTYGHRWRDAVDATAGEVVTVTPASGTLAQTYYSSSTGGATEHVSDVWNSNQSSFPYLVSKPDPWSAMSASAPTENTTIRWRHVRSAGQIVTALNSGSSACSAAMFPGLTELINIQIPETHESGSPRMLRITGIANGQVATKDLTLKSSSCANRIGTLRSRLGVWQSHYIHSFTGFDYGDRLAGANRFETAVAISQDSYPSGADVVYLAVGTNYPDALASGPAAAHEGAPILLAHQGSLPDITRTELQRLDPTTIRILGGPAAISDSVVAAVGSAVPGASVSRLAGADRYATAVEISKASFTDAVETVYISTGENFPDGLVAAPAAAYAGGPLLLVRPNAIPSVVQDELTRLAPTRIVIVGGTAAVSANVQNALSVYAATVDRITAGDRYAASAAVSAATFPATTEIVYVAVGTDFPDALAGGTAMGTALGPILLVQPTGIPSSVANELNRIRPARIVVLGGPAVIPEWVASQLSQYLG